MSKKLHIIYIPGLGDDDPSGQRMAVKTWRWWGVDAELFQMKWSDDVPWRTKFDRLLARIDEIVAAGNQVGLVGASAGASAAINAFAARKEVVAGVVIIAGKANRPDAIGQKYHLKNPSFIGSVNDCQAALETLDEADRQRILSRYAFVDEIVTKADSYIPGAINHAQPIIGHAPMIAAQIFVGSISFLRFLKRLAVR